MSVVGLDQSYTGFGYSVNGLALKRGFPMPAEGPVQRLVYVRTWLTNLLKSFNNDEKIDLVVMEGYANGAKFGREMAGELGGIVKTTVWDVLGMSPLVVSPTSLKKFVLGKGAGKKSEMLLGVYKQWGHSFGDDNQADAFALERVGLAYLGKPAPVLKYQIEVIEAVRKGK